MRFLFLSTEKKEALPTLTETSSFEEKDAKKKVFEAALPAEKKEGGLLSSGISRGNLCKRTSRKGRSSARLGRARKRGGKPFAKRTEKGGGIGEEGAPEGEKKKGGAPGGGYRKV